MGPISRLVAPALLIATVHVARAQSVGAPVDTTVVAWSALTERPRFQDTAHVAHVRFPSMLGGAHLGGDVHVEVIIGRDGVPERSSIRVVSSTHDLFTNSVRFAIRDWRLTPPMVNGQAVRASIPVFVSFLMPPAEEPSREIGAVVVDSIGVHISLGREGIPRQLGLVSNRADSSAATAAVLTKLLSIAQSMKASGICVSLGDEGRTISADVLRALRATHPKVRDPAHCPRTYTSMILEVDSLGKPVLPPKGALDPVWLSATNVRPWARDLFVMRGSVAQGTGTDWYRCQARREQSGRAWTATCELTGMTVSLNENLIWQDVYGRMRIAGPL
jgi:TonB family protein